MENTTKNEISNRDNKKSEDLLEYFNPHKQFMDGTETFTFNGSALPNTIKDYWCWAFSDLYNNIYRGILAEYIVATALRITPPPRQFSTCSMEPF